MEGSNIKDQSVNTREKGINADDSKDKANDSIDTNNTDDGADFRQKKKKSKKRQVREIILTLSNQLALWDVKFSDKYTILDTKKASASKSGKSSKTKSKLKTVNDEKTNIDTIVEAKQADDKGDKEGKEDGQLKLADESKAVIKPSFSLIDKNTEPFAFMKPVMALEVKVDDTDGVAGAKSKTGILGDAEELKENDSFSSFNNVDVAQENVSINTSVKANTKRGQAFSITGITNPYKPINPMVAAVSERQKRILNDRNRDMLRTKKHPYIKKSSPLTEAEKKLYKFLWARLQKINPNLALLSKVRLADILDLDESISNKSSEFYKIAYKHIDYLILDMNLDIICAVELDDFTHETDRAIERDRFVNSVMEDCGIKLFRIGKRITQVTEKDTYSLEMFILEYLAPRCPICGRPTEVKVSRRRKNYGHRFYGCLGFYERGDKRCDYTVDID